MTSATSFLASGGEHRDGSDEPEHRVGADERGGREAVGHGVLPARHTAVRGGRHQEGEARRDTALHGRADCSQCG